MNSEQDSNAQKKTAVFGKGATRQSSDTESKVKPLLHAAWTHCQRAFSIQLLDYQTTNAENTTLTEMDPAIQSATFKALLIWRKSLLLVAGVLMAPLLIFEILQITTSLSKMSEQVERARGALRLSGLADAYETIFALQATVSILSLMTGVALAVAIWTAFSRWTQWTRSRNVLFWTWLCYFLAPFVIYLLPIRLVLSDAGIHDRLLLMFGTIWGMQASMFLGPKVLSLMPAILRASILTKVLFPGSATPGWLMTLAAPLYALMVFLVLVMPLQTIGSWPLLVAIVAFIGAPIWLWKAGYRLAVPMDQRAALAEVAKARSIYYGFNSVGLIFMIVAFAEMLETLDWGFAQVAHPLLSFFATLFVLSVIVTDRLIKVIVTAKQTTIDPSTTEPQQQFELDLWDFVADQERDDERAMAMRPKREKVF